MATYTVFPDTADNLVTSYSTTWPQTFAGTGSFVISGASNTSIYLNIIDNSGKSGTEYDASEGFESFDTTAISGSETVTAATLSLWGNNVNGGVVPRDVEVYAYDWGTSVDTSDFRNAAWLSSATKLAFYTISGNGGTWSTTGYNAFTENGTSFQAAIVKGGSTRLVLCQSELRTQTSPSLGTGFAVSYSSGDSTGTTNDPKLVITTVAASSSSSVLDMMGVG